ncbi:iron complex transport system permease protein [Pseudomonas duriflava]|uniref:Iron complex transport system permease protein n=1 Tax=Pseudomonas duriflava TaxID=459528 RepID=A0A562QL65_9PSED|nr:iron chelate uptake ABC transporter family permease subunit [Pseudomonas duriflava]TWI57459.1 iron complex transport system permease protein [Pseudomonas duriflava]
MNDRPSPVIADTTASPAISFPWRALLTALALCSLLLIVILASLSLGARDMSSHHVVDLLMAPDSSADSVVIWQMRLPRTVLGLLVGAALGLAGTLIQALTRNPLADPGLLGINSGAAFAVVVGLSLFGIDDAGVRLAAALGGSAFCAVLVYILGGSSNGKNQHTRLVLAGVAISVSLGACTGIITLFDSAVFDSYRFWAVGALNSPPPGLYSVLLPVIGLGAVIALSLGGKLNALALGDDLALALGAQPVQVRALSFLAITLLCGSATAAAGPIGFVGLVVPHALRLLVGQDWRWIMWLSPLAGAALVLVSDILGRLIVLPGELEVGIVCALIGTPVLLGLIIHFSRRSR